MSVGGIPERFDVLLDMRRLSRLLEHRVQEQTCRVEAGILHSTLQQQLGTRGQRLPLDPADSEQSSLGGLLATDTSGPFRLRYGTLRDFVIDMRVVQADGTIVSSRDSIGALGTLGVIVEAELRLVPQPPTERTLLLTYTQVSDAMDTALALLASPLEPTAIELIDAGAASDLSSFFGISMPTNGYTLALLLEEDTTIVEQHIHDMQALARTHHAFLTDELQDKPHRDFWNALRNHTQGTVTCMISLPVHALVSYTHEIERICSRYSLDFAVIAHAGNGILYLELRPGDAVQRLLDAIAALDAAAHTLQGILVVERCPIDLRRRIRSQQGYSEWPHLAAIRHRRRQVDPTGTFARGNALQ
jgi:FAD/FMN-containing dehydrogenase